MNPAPGLGSLPVELFYKVQLFALSDTLPHVCRHLYRVFKSASPSFHAEYILGRVFADSADRKILTRALRYPLCTAEVLDPLCRYIGGARAYSFSKLPQRLFRDLPVRGSEWTEHDHPLPFLKHLYNHPSIYASTIFIDLRYALEAGKAGFRPLISFLLDRMTSWERTLLLRATGEGCEEVVRVLLTRDDIDANAQGRDGMTLLCWAAAVEHEEMVKMLLSQDDIDVNSKDGLGRTPISCAAVYGSAPAVKLLLARDDVNVNSKDTQGDTALCLAAARGYEEVVRLLLARDDIDVNSKNKLGRTSIFFAAVYGSAPVVKLLLARDNIDVNSRDMDGNTPLSWAVDRDSEEVVKLLLARDDIDVNWRRDKAEIPSTLDILCGDEIDIRAANAVSSQVLVLDVS